MTPMHATREDNPMHPDIVADQWTPRRGARQSWWGKLADGDVDRIEGQQAHLSGGVQAPYGDPRDQAQQAAARLAGGAATAVGETMGALASVMRDQALHAGTLATAATAVAGGLAAARASRHENGDAHIAPDRTAMRRRDPVPSLWVGVGPGEVLARMTKD
jgi:uncharacterized protein YjbJ (UPF0337 family)